MLDISYYRGNDDLDSKIKKFKELYFDTIKRAKELYQANKGKRGKNSMYYWELSNLLREFNEKTENEFKITNYSTSLERDFGVSDSHIRVIFDFGKFFKKEVMENIPISVYIELIWKKRKLDKLGLFEKEKNRLLKMAKDNNVPPHKKYREILKELIRSHIVDSKNIVK